MKKIAVLTDFSETAAHAAEYAFKLGSYLKADILLYHCLLTPAKEPVFAGTAFSSEGNDELQRSCAATLQRLSVQIRKIAEEFSYDAYVPRVFSYCPEGQPELKVRFDEDSSVILAVAGTHHETLPAIAAGDHLGILIENINIPLLVVPLQAEPVPLKKILLASDLDPEDVNVVQSLTTLAKPFDAELSIVHVCNSARHHTPEFDRLISKIGAMIHYPKISFTELYQDAGQGLMEVRDALSFDLLTMVHRKKGTLRRLFTSSNTLSMLKGVEQPLLIFPYPSSTLFGF